MSISQESITGGLTFAAAGLATAMVGWSYAEDSNGFLPAYKVEAIEATRPLVEELIQAERWLPVEQGGITYGYRIINGESNERTEEAVVEVGISDLARVLVEEAQAEPDDETEGRRSQGTSEEQQRIIDAVPHHDLKPASTVIRSWSLAQFTDEDLNDAFDEFREEFPGDAPNSDDLFDTYIKAVKATKSISKVTAAAGQYTGRLSAHRWFKKELYLDEEAFRHEA
ncbi:hypothetical protein ABC337_13905 [Arthrobacter sp. 1P04PC]|uniref:hypothetical protein n=1 Tax=unclassified Arthrobacter TaxID=235627 RepID=UPI0039A237EB